MYPARFWERWEIRRSLYSFSVCRFSHPWGNPLTRLVETLSFRLVLFQTINSSNQYLAIKKTTALPWQNVGVLERAAQECVKVYLGSKVKPNMRVWEVRSVSIPD